MSFFPINRFIMFMVTFIVVSFGFYIAHENEPSMRDKDAIHLV